MVRRRTARWRALDRPRQWRKASRLLSLRAALCDNNAVVRPAATIVVGLLVWATPAWAVSPAGPEFRVNSFTTGNQIDPDVAALDDGGFIVVWISAAGQDGDLAGVFGQRYAASGNKSGAEFQVNEVTTGDQRQAAVAGLADGGFVVVWVSRDDEAIAADVRGRAFDSAGDGDTEFEVNVYTPSDQAFPRVAALSDGGFVVVWDSDGQDGSGQAVIGRMFDADGTPQSNEFQTNQFTTGDQRTPAVAVAPDDSFVVAWTSASGQDGSSLGLFGRRYDATGTPQGDEFQINAITTDSQTRAAVVHLPGGGFLVAWEARRIEPEPSNTDGIAARVFDSDGTASQGEFQVNSYTTGHQEDVALSLLASGEIFVVWEAEGGSPGGTSPADTDDDGIFARTLDATGAPTASEFQINTYTTSEQDDPRTAAIGGDRFVVVWESTGQDGSNAAIQGRLFSTAETVTTTTTGSTASSTVPQSTTVTTTPTSNSSTTSSSITTTSSTTMFGLASTTSTTMHERPVTCGDIVGTRRITAADALAVLEAAVGGGSCEPCQCDVDSSGTIAASDALLILRFAVGQAVELDCPSCTLGGGLGS